MANIEHYTNQARTVRNAWEQELNRIRAIGLRDDVARPHIAKAWMTARDHLDGLRERFKTETADAQTRASQKAHGVRDLVPPGGDAAMTQLLHRDAQERVEGADSAKTQRILEQAIATGDAVLARAAATRAYHMRFLDALDLYEAHNPGWLDTAKDAQQVARGDALWSAATFSLIKPDELRELNPYEIRRLATEAP